MTLEKLITLEETNSLLNLNPNFSMDYIINTGLIPLSYFENGFKDFMYDFNVINMEKEKGNLKISSENGYYILDIDNLNKCIINFKVMLELNDIINNHCRMVIGDYEYDLIDDLGFEINPSIETQTKWYEITLIVQNDLVYLFKNNELMVSEDSHISHFGFVFDGINELTLNIKNYTYTNSDTDLIFSDDENTDENHWNYNEDEISRDKINNNLQTLLKGNGYIRPNLDDVFYKSKLYKNKNHMINFKYHYDETNNELFYDKAVSNKHNSNYINLDGEIQYTFEGTIFRHKDLSLQYNYLNPNVEISKKSEIEFDLIDHNGENYIVFSDEQYTVSKDVSDEKYSVDISDLPSECKIKISKTNNNIIIKYKSINENTWHEIYNDEVDLEKMFMYFVVGEESDIKYYELKILNTNDTSFSFGNYDKTIFTDFHIDLEDEDDVKIFIINEKIWIFVNDEYVDFKLFNENDEYSYTLFYFNMNDSVFEYDWFRMYTFDIINYDQNDWFYENIEKTEEGIYHYIIEVYNKLWTGEVTFNRIAEGEEVILYTDNKLNYNNETYIFHILCTDDDFDIILKLDNNHEGERYFENLKPKIELIDDEWIDEYPKKISTIIPTEESDEPMKMYCKDGVYSYPYYKEPKIKLTVKDSYNKILPNTNVIIPKTIYSTQTTLKTNNEGVITFKPKRLKPGTYKAKLTVKKQGYKDTYISIVLKPQKETPKIIYKNGTTYWGGFVDDKIKIVTESNYKVDMKITCKQSNINSKVSKKISTNNYYTHSQSYRNKRLKNSSLTVEIKGTDWSKPIKKSFTKNHSLKYVDDWNELKNEINNNKGVDIIGLYKKNYEVGNNPIYFKRNIEIVGINNKNGWATIKNAKGYAFISNSPYDNKFIKLMISNVNFRDNKKVFKNNVYSNLELENCLFYHNGNGGIGVCIETPISNSYIKKNYGHIKLTSCNFINNKGSCIGVSMHTTIDTCRFGLNDWKYAQHPQAWALEFYGQNSSVKNTDFAIVMSGQSPLSILKHSNFSHGKSILRIGTSSTVNGIKGSSCKKDNSSPLLSNGNTSYIYAKYLYDGVNVTASSKPSYERKSHDHIVNGTDWAWKNNVNVSTIIDNTKNKPKIEVPSSPIINKKWLKVGGRIKW